MEEAVGYATVDCAQQAAVADVLTLKHDRIFLLVDRNGNVTPEGQCGLGLFHDDTRILSLYELHFLGGEPVLLS